MPPSERVLTSEVHDLDVRFAAALPGDGRPAHLAARVDARGLGGAGGVHARRSTRSLLDSGELVETRGLSAPVHTRRVRLKEGVPVVTDGPYAEAEEVLAGYWVVECESFDRATEIASRLAGCPGPEHLRARAYADVRPIDEHQPDFEG